MVPFLIAGHILWYITHTHTVPPESLLSPEQVHATVELAKRAKQACQNVSTDHKDIHASISKFGRAIDKVSLSRSCMTTPTIVDRLPVDLLVAH